MKSPVKDKMSSSLIGEKLAKIHNEDYASNPDHNKNMHGEGRNTSIAEKERKGKAPNKMKKSGFKMKGFSGFGNSPIKDKKFHKKNSTKEDKVGVLDHNIKHSDNIWNENHEVNAEKDRTQRKLRMDVPAIEDRFDEDES